MDDRLHRLLWPDRGQDILAIAGAAGEQSGACEYAGCWPEQPVQPVFHAVSLPASIQPLLWPY